MTADLKFPDERRAEAWQTYLETEKLGSRVHMMNAMRRFIESMADATQAERDAFVESWCLSYLDGSVQSSLVVRNGQWMRQPMFTVLFAPVVEAGRIAGKANYARWSSQLYYMFCTANRARGIYEPSREDLLREALRIDPADNRARGLLVIALLESLDYACHELPSGLLLYPSVLLSHAVTVEATLAPTIWSEQSRKGLAAIRRIANGDWSEVVVGDAFELFSMRHSIARSLLPLTRGRTFLE